MQTQNIFRALSDPSRRNIISLLAQRDMTIAEVADNFDMTRAAIKKHLNILQEGDLISVTTQGRERINHLEPAALQMAAGWINHYSHFWDTRLHALQSAIETSITEKE